MKRRTTAKIEIKAYASKRTIWLEIRKDDVCTAASQAFTHSGDGHWAAQVPVYGSRELTTQDVIETLQFFLSRNVSLRDLVAANCERIEEEG